MALFQVSEFLNNNGLQFYLEILMSDLVCVAVIIFTLTFRIRNKKARNQSRNQS